MEDLPWTRLFTAPVVALDAEMARLMTRQRREAAACVNLVASETYAPRAALEAEASALVDKNASGYPPRLGFGGGEVMDAIERLACDRAKTLFGAEHANIQALSSTIANAAVLRALMKPGERILAFDPSAGGHGSHGGRKHLSGQDYEARFFGLLPDGRVDYDAAERLAVECPPRMIIAGSSAYPLPLEFGRLARIAERCGALFFADIAHVAGLVAAGLHENPVPFSDVVTTSTHKTLCGPRTGGLILCRARHAAAIDAALAPGLQAAPGGHIIAARAVLFRLVTEPSFRLLMQAVLDGAAALADGLREAGVAPLAGGTGTHMVVADLRGTGWDSGLNGALFAQGVLANTTGIPGGMGLRLGSTPMVVRGLDPKGFRAVGLALGTWLRDPAAPLGSAMAEVATAHPIPPGLEPV